MLLLETGVLSAILRRQTRISQGKPMQPMTTIALRAARKAGEIIARATEQVDLLDVEEKGVNDFVTEIDKAAEKEVIYHISKAHPDHGFLGEEGGHQGNPDSEYQWIIDPLDGTTNFIRGIPHFAVSIACLYKGQLEHAVIYDPMRREEFITSRGRGAQLNGHRIRVSPRKSLDGALVGTGIPYKSRSEVHIPAYMDSLEAIAKQTAGVRRAGVLQDARPQRGLRIDQLHHGRHDQHPEYVGQTLALDLHRPESRGSDPAVRLPEHGDGLRGVRDLL
jgi:myo-inositol-1(or 4)-monophosphatase